jgi:drug/metabolite transporter (DMT)-like permease
VLLEQYKLYVEMADRVSARRGLANTFFLAINTAVFTALGVFWVHRPPGPAGLLIVPWAVLVVQCLAWFWILRSYRQLNTAKYAVIGVMEERLPASPYWAAEWAALGRGEDPARYWPLSHVEQWIPGLFAAGYTAGLLLALFA